MAIPPPAPLAVLSERMQFVMVGEEYAVHQIPPPSAVVKPLVMVTPFSTEVESSPELKMKPLAAPPQSMMQRAGSRLFDLTVMALPRKSRSRFPGPVKVVSQKNVLFQ